MRPVVVAAALALLVTGCAADDVDGADDAAGGEGAGTDPFVVLVESVSSSEELAPWTSCRSGDGVGVCADGVPPADPVDLGASEAVTVTFPDGGGWAFAATFWPAGSRTEPVGHVDLDGVADGAPLVAPRCGTWDVDVSGGDDGGNDLVTTFRWTATAARDPAGC